jgi:hypothetical protein
MALQPITVNSGTLVRQPSKLREYREYIQTDKQAIDGAIQRNRIRTAANPLGFKYNVEMIFENITITDFQALDTYFTAGSGVNYYNPSSKYGVLSFSGLPYPDETDDYGPGESLLTTYKVKIRQF